MFLARLARRNTEGAQVSDRVLRGDRERFGVAVDAHAVRSRDWRLISYADGSMELYDHRSDPDECTNLADDPQHRSTRDELAAWLPKEAAPEVRTESKYEHLRGQGGEEK